VAGIVLVSCGQRCRRPFSDALHGPTPEQYWLWQPCTQSRPAAAGTRESPNNLKAPNKLLV